MDRFNSFPTIFHVLNIYLKELSYYFFTLLQRRVKIIRKVTQGSFEIRVLFS